MSVILILLLSIFLTPINLNAQPETRKYIVELESVHIASLPGLHSFAFGQHEGKWLLMGGRTDGLHARRPNESFPLEYNNQQLVVVDPESKEYWTASVTALPTGISEQLQATNMNFHQWGDTLYIIGGYAYSETADNHITFPKLTTVRVSKVIDQIIDGTLDDQYFSHLYDERLAVTGGQLGRIGDELYLVGGHRFDGRYNPRDMPSFTQTYTNAIQRFAIGHTPDATILSHHSVIDTDHLRRRDYNLAPFQFTDGRPGYLISSGVFQEDADLPFLYPVEIDDESYYPVPEFEQLLSHYHSPKFSFYDSSTDALHMIFLGGLAQYYYEEGQLIQDDRVPFVTSISRVSRAADGTYSEHLHQEAMPGFLGTSAEFIPNPALARNATGVLLLNEIPDERILIGHMAGGIVSPIRNPFSENLTDLTYADKTIYRIWLTAGDVTRAGSGSDDSDSDRSDSGFDGSDFGSESGSGTLPDTPQLNQNYPNPFNPSTVIPFILPEPSNVRITVHNVLGNHVVTLVDAFYLAGRHQVTFEAGDLASGTYIYRLTVENKGISQRMMLLR